jgi:hypothetical protein
VDAAAHGGRCGGIGVAALTTVHQVSETAHGLLLDLNMVTRGVHTFFAQKVSVACG